MAYGRAALAAYLGVRRTQRVTMRRAIGIVCFIGVLGLALLWIVGITVRTTHLAFVDDGGARQVPGALQLQLTPSKDPWEAQLIGMATRLRVPVRVVVPGPDGEVSFRVRRGDGAALLIPCAGHAECCRMLTALKYPCLGGPSRVGL